MLVYSVNGNNRRIHLAFLTQNWNTVNWNHFVSPSYKGRLEDFFFFLSTNLVLPFLNGILQLIIPCSCTSPRFLSSLCVQLSSLSTPLQAYNSGSSGAAVTSLPASSQKRLDDGAARFTNANFQEVSSTHSSSSSKEGLATDSGKAVPEAKNKKNSGGSHGVGQRGGRKSLTSSGKPLPSAVVTMATSSTSASASTGPFHQGK